jgi:hypothetical protein
MQNRIAQRNYRKRRANINPHSPAKARIGKKIKQRLALLESRASSKGASPDLASSKSGSRECFRYSEPQSTAVSSPHKLCTADLHQSQDDYLQGRSFISSQQHADELLGALLPVVPSSPLTPSTSGLAAEAAAQSINRFLHTSYRLPTAAVCSTASYALNHSLVEGYYICSDSGPFKEGYLAINGASRA